MLTLVKPDAEHLPGYIAALRQGWSPDNTRPEAAAEQLLEIESDPVTFLASLEDREGKGPPVLLADDTLAPRIPGYHRWMWDGEFCGQLGFRWQPGTTALPPHCPGHIGYAVVPWKRRRGYATRALALLLQEVAAEGLPWVELVTTADNVPSQRVIESNGGRVVGRFRDPDAHGGVEGLRFRIDL